MGVGVHYIPTSPRRTKAGVRRRGVQNLTGQENLIKNSWYTQIEKLPSLQCRKCRAGPGECARNVPGFDVQRRSAGREHCTRRQTRVPAPRARANGAQVGVVVAGRDGCHPGRCRPPRLERVAPSAGRGGRPRRACPAPHRAAAAAAAAPTQGLRPRPVAPTRAAAGRRCRRRRSSPTSRPTEPSATPDLPSAAREGDGRADGRVDGTFAGGGACVGGPPLARNRPPAPFRAVVSRSPHARAHF